MKFIKNMSAYWKTVLLLAVILYLSFAPPSTFDSVSLGRIPHADKITHFLMYMALTIMIIYDLYKKNGVPRFDLKFFFGCIVFPIILGGVVELMQEAFFKPRTASWFDWLADALGVLAGWGLMAIYFRRKQLKEKA